MHWIYNKPNFFKLSALLLVLSSLACSSPPKKVSKKDENTVYIKASFDKVWRSAQVALNIYPIEISNMDKGYTKTRSVQLNSIFKPIHTDVKVFNGDQYTLTIHMLKGSIRGQEVVKITATKRIQRKRDFFSPPEKIESDGLEEQMILYRIQRETIIDNIFERRANSQ